MPETRQQEFVGKIKKCPNCGQPFQSFKIKCPSCGFEFSGIEAVKSVKDFFYVYQRENNKWQRLELIKNFPVPNSKEDILEFAILASQQTKSLANSQNSKLNLQNYMMSTLNEQGGILGAYKNVFTGNQNQNKVSQEDFYIAWKNKLEQIQLKAKLAFGEDKEDFEQLSKIVSEAFEEVNNLQKKQKATKKKIITMTVISFIFLIVFALVPLVFLKKTGQLDFNPRETENTRLENLMTEIQSEIEAGEYDSAELKLMDLRWKEGASDNKYYQSEREIWNSKRELLQKQIDSKLRGGK